MQGAYEGAGYHDQQPVLAGETAALGRLGSMVGRLALPQYYASAAEGASLQVSGPEDGSSHEPIGVDQLVQSEVRPPHLAARPAPKDANKHGGLTPHTQRDAAQERQELEAIMNGAARAGHVTRQGKASQN